MKLPDAWRDDRFNRDADAKAGYRSRSLLCHPIKNSKDQVIAVIQLINKRGADGKADGTSRFSALDEELIAAFGAQLAVSIENVLAINEMSKAGSAFKQQQQWPGTSTPSTPEPSAAPKTGTTEPGAIGPS